MPMRSTEDVSPIQAHPATSDRGKVGDIPLGDVVKMVRSERNKFVRRCKGQTDELGRIVLRLRDRPTDRQNRTSMMRCQFRSLATSVPDQTLVITAWSRRSHTSRSLKHPWPRLPRCRQARDAVLRCQVRESHVSAESPSVLDVTERAVAQLGRSRR